MNKSEDNELQQFIGEITGMARSFGLDFYDMRFEVVPADVLYTFGAYQGMPTRYTHWTFGKAFHRMKVDYDLGIGRIYELVINSDPCYAFLLENNSLLQNKMVAAHVLGHSDFFKHNAMFRHTVSYMVDSMAANAERFRSYERQYGKLAVELFLDAALAIQEHIDPSERGRHREPEGEQEPRILEKDVLGFIIHHSRNLLAWQRDILTALREEMMYFWPQIETKVMNEGWATYWHQRIMRAMDLPTTEAIEFAQMHADVILPSKSHVNPYLLGLKIWESIEKRYDDPTNTVGSKMFEVRETESDQSFIRNYLTRELVEELDLYLYQKVGNEWRIIDKDWEKIRDKLWTSRVNGGYPVLYVQDGDYQMNGELYLLHAYEGIELDVQYAERTLPHVFSLWGKTVYLETVLEGRSMVFTYDGKRVQRKFL